MDDPLGHPNERLTICQTIKQDHKLVATNTCNRIVAAGLFHHDTRHVLQDMVARRMAKRVIHRFEEIQINMHQGKFAPRLDQPRQHMVHSAAVLQPRQRIGKGLLFRRNHCALQSQIKLSRRLHGR